MTVTRCVNLDWLEVACLEPKSEPRNLWFWQKAGFEVHQRDYGTRVFGEVLTLYDTHGEPFLEIRRAPKTSILIPEYCTLRLVNRYCYFNNAAAIMRDFMQKYDYFFQRIARVDICMDFEKFDTGDDPYKFIVRYLNGTYSKINQANVHSHGTDRWDGRDWNSLSWGSPTSAIGTKLYDKTMELFDQTTQQFKKPWIREAWLHCGLVDNFTYCTKTKPDGTVYTPRIWRLEFSIRSAVKKWFVINPDGRENKKNSLPNTLEMYDERAKLLVMFISLVHHYFRFKHYYPGIRKDRCPDKELFRWHNQEFIYKVAREEVLPETKAERSQISLISKLKALREKTIEPIIKQSCTVLIDALENRRIMADAGGRAELEYIEALQWAFKWQLKGTHMDETALINEYREMMKLMKLGEIF